VTLGKILEVLSRKRPRKILMYSNLENFDLTRKKKQFCWSISTFN